MAVLKVENFFVSDLSKTDKSQLLSVHYGNEEKA